jgi:hypothetical protein
MTSAPPAVLPAFLVGDSSSRPLFVVLLAVAAACAIVASVPAIRAILARNTLRSIGAGDRLAIATTTQTWWRRRHFGLAAGIAIGDVASVFFAYYIGADRSGSATGMILLGTLSFSALGAAIGGLRGRRTVSGLRRVAHSRSMTLADYVPVWSRWGARVAVAAAVAGITTQAIATTVSPFVSVLPQNLGIAFLVVVPAVAGLLIFESGARIVVGRRGSAESPTGLAIEDTLKCMTLQDFARAALALGTLAFLFSAPEAISAIAPRFPFQLTYATLDAIEIMLVVAFIAVWTVVPTRLKLPRRLRRDVVASTADAN